jgi:hypothetical protein
LTTASWTAENPAVKLRPEKKPTIVKGGGFSSMCDLPAGAV